MARTPRPTDAELSILRVLWTRGPSTVREIHDHMADTRSVAYTTTLKTLQVMTDKGLTMRADVRGQHVYRPRDDRTRHTSPPRHRPARSRVRRVDGAAGRSGAGEQARDARGVEGNPQAARRREKPKRGRDVIDALTASPVAWAAAGALIAFRLAGRDHWRGHRDRIGTAAAPQSAPRYLIACTGLAALCAAPVVTGFHRFDPDRAIVQRAGRADRARPRGRVGKRQRRSSDRRLGSALDGRNAWRELPSGSTPGSLRCCWSGQLECLCWRCGWVAAG